MKPSTPACTYLAPISFGNFAASARYSSPPSTCGCRGVLYWIRPKSSGTASDASSQNWSNEAGVIGMNTGCPTCAPITPLSAAMRRRSTVPCVFSQVTPACDGIPTFWHSSPNASTSV